MRSTAVFALSTMVQSIPTDNQVHRVMAALFSVAQIFRDRELLPSKAEVSDCRPTNRAATFLFGSAWRTIGPNRCDSLKRASNFLNKACWIASHTTKCGHRIKTIRRQNRDIEASS